jgi:hypothetical protein
VSGRHIGRNFFNDSQELTTIATIATAALLFGRAMTKYEYARLYTQCAKYPWQGRLLRPSAFKFTVESALFSNLLRSSRAARDAETIKTMIDKSKNAMERTPLAEELPGKSQDRLLGLRCVVFCAEYLPFLLSRAAKKVRRLFSSHVCFPLVSFL